MGATDPTSGTVSTYEVIRGLGALMKKGWRPLRTIVIASWDAEEVIIPSFQDCISTHVLLQYGLIGSTEWGEDFADWIENNVVAYLNLGELAFSFLHCTSQIKSLDSSVSGSRFGLAASPSLAHLGRDTAMQIEHPTDPSRTLWDARLDRGVLSGAFDAEAVEAYELEFGVPAFPNASLVAAQAGEVAASQDVSIGVGRLDLEATLRFSCNILV